MNNEKLKSIIERKRSEIIALEKQEVEIRKAITDDDYTASELTDRDSGVHILPENIPLNIIYEDASVIIVEKPAGMIVHPGAGHRSGTLVNALLFHCSDLSGINGVLRPGIVHRLDKNTSGLLVVAKSDNSHLFLTRQFETREIERTYQAIVWGLVARDVGQIDTLIDRSFRDRKKMSVSSQRGRKAITNFNTEEKLQYFSLLNLTLGTGRTHQIRVHLAAAGHDHRESPGRKAQPRRQPQRPPRRPAPGAVAQGARAGRPGRSTR